MASKKDLVEAQTFSRRRLLTAFVSGAPGGRELEPTKPLRAVVSGVALTGLLVVGSLVAGLLKPSLPEGWDHNTLVVTKGSGSRYVALDGVLYPVLNTTSARLLVSGGLEVVQVDEKRIAETPRGITVGIPGAPDELPAPDSLIGTAWLACTDAQGATTTVLSRGEQPEALAAAVTAQDAPAEAGLLVRTGGDQYLVTNGRRHLVPRAETVAVLRAIGQETVVPWDVSAQWLNLFAPGEDLEPIVVEGARSQVPAGTAAPPDAVVGSVLSVSDADGRRYVVDSRGELAPLSDFAEQLYRLGSGADVGPDLEVTLAQIQGMPTSASPAGGADWPTEVPASLPDGEPACAFLLTDTQDEGVEPTVHLVSGPDVAIEQEAATVWVEPAGGALVRASGGAGVAGPVQLIDQTGRAFALPDASDDVLTRLGYTSEDIVTVPQTWLSLFPTGPALTVAAAQQSATVSAG